MPTKQYNLDHVITINRLTGAANTYNEKAATFAPYITIRSSRQDASAGESWRSAEVGAQIDAHFVVRNSPETETITAKDTLTLEDGKTYNIVGIRELDRNRWFEIHASARPDK